MYPPPQQFTPVYDAPIHHQHHHNPVSLQQQLVSPQPFISPLVTQQSQAEIPQLDFGLAVPTFQQTEDPIECINKAMAFLYVVASSGIATTSRGNYVAGQAKVGTCYHCLGEGYMAKIVHLAKEAETFYVVQREVDTIPHNSAFQTKDLDAYESDCDDISWAKADLMANPSCCDSDVLSE
nr:hypothetical protein [Tanacetum cinerariifolium]